MPKRLEETNETKYSRIEQLKFVAYNIRQALFGTFYFKCESLDNINANAIATSSITLIQNGVTKTPVNNFPYS